MTLLFPDRQGLALKLGTVPTLAPLPPGQWVAGMVQLFALVRSQLA